MQGHTVSLGGITEGQAWSLGGSSAGASRGRQRLLVAAVQGQAGTLGGSSAGGRWQQYRDRQGLLVAAMQGQAGSLGFSSARAGMES